MIIPTIMRLCAWIRAFHDSLNRTRQITRLYEMRRLALQCGDVDAASAFDAEIDRLAAGGAA